MAARAIQDRTTLVEAAVELAAERGLAGVGPRPLLSKGIHRSAVTYHLGSRAKLLDLVYSEVLARRRSELEGAIADIALQPRDLRSMEGFLVSWASLRAFGSYGLEAFLMEADSRPDLFSAEMETARVADIEARRVLWAKAAEAHACAREGHCWFLLSEGLGSYVLLHESLPARLSWLPAAAFRFADRLARRSPRLIAPRPAHEDGLGVEETNYSGPSLAVVMAAADLLLARRQITLRAIAAASGVPLSTVKYLFPDGDDIISGAYRMIHKRIFGGLDPQQSISGALTMGDHFDNVGNVHGVTIAFQTLASLVARNPRLSALRHEMRRLRGRLAEQQLVANGLSADRLDGLIWTFVTDGAISEALTSPPQERRAHVERLSRDMRKALFGL